MNCKTNLSTVYYQGSSSDQNLEWKCLINEWANSVYAQIQCQHLLTIIKGCGVN